MSQSWLDRFFVAARVLANGEPRPIRPNLDFGAGFTVTDDPEAQTTRVVVGSAAGDGSAVGVLDVHPAAWVPTLGEQEGTSNVYLVLRKTGLNDGFGANLVLEGDNVPLSGIDVEDVTSGALTGAMSWTTRSDKSGADGGGLTDASGDGDADPRLHSTARAFVTDTGTPFTLPRTLHASGVSFDLYWTSHLFIGPSDFDALGDRKAPDPEDAVWFFDTGVIQLGFQYKLSRTRSWLNAGLTLADQYAVVGFPDHAQYTGGTPILRVVETGGIYPLVDMGTRTVDVFGNTRTYRGYRTPIRMSGTLHFDLM